MFTKREVSLNLKESTYLDMLKDRTNRVDPKASMLNESMPGRQHKALPPEGSVDEEKDKDKDEKEKDSKE